MNQQPIEKREPSYEGTLQVHSIFKTIQGEGPFCGTPCVFVRLAGCNLQCPSCDTDYTSNRTSLTPQDILHDIGNLWTADGRKPGLVVITGGEPFRQHIGELLDLLILNGFYVQIESNGTMNPPIGPWWNNDINARDGAYLVISPKTGKINSLAEQTACALKYVVRHGMIAEDGLPITALDHSVKVQVARPSNGWRGPIYIQPIDVGNVLDNDIHTAAAVDSCLTHGHILQLQIHKLIGVE